MFVKLIRGVNFTNIFLKPFLCTDPKSAKKYSHVVSLFAILWSVWVKDALKMIVKLIPGVNFINVKRANFSYEHRFYTWVWLEKSCQNNVRTKNSHVERWWNWFQEDAVGTMSISGTVYGVLSALFVALFSIYNKRTLPELKNDAFLLTFYNNLVSISSMFYEQLLHQ